jgi:hypothetical protein
MYGEVRGLVIAGIRTGNCRIRTRAKKWRIRWGAGTRVGSVGFAESGAVTGAGTRVGSVGLAGSGAVTGAGTRVGSVGVAGSGAATGAGRELAPADLPGAVPPPVPGMRAKTRRFGRPRSSLDPWQ